MITVPRPILVAVLIGFSAYNLVLGAFTVPGNPHPDRVIVALAMFAAITVVSVAVGYSGAQPLWVAALTVGVSVAIVLLVSSTLDPRADLGLRTWYVGAIGALMTVSAVRRHTTLAGFGIALLIAHTVLWAGPAAVLRFGVLGDVIWVVAAYVFSYTLARANNDVLQFARAEREAVEWQAAQDAHHFERQVRLTQTSRLALPMLQRIAESGGELTDDERLECRVLEQSIRDEIRGRRLLNDAVRREVVTARRRGAFVQVLDDGGVDDIDPKALDPVLNRVAEALASVQAERWIIRTAPKSSARAVTVVGLSSGQSTASALGLDDDEENVDLWLELDRPTA
ncbi:hypothetical protein [uncultured Amnibacterium sp.]|uniref:hypothetical protein n=1 Tax=uncultured Amnibacterium sp. TaxID=1631851 RepID=UPI0035CBBB2C